MRSAAGQRADALAIYQSLRRRLTEELGVEPGTEIRAAHRTIVDGPSTSRLATEPAERPAQPEGDGVTHIARLVVGSDDIGTGGQVRSSMYIDYSIQARWADAGLSIRELAAAGVGPVELNVAIEYRQELVLGNEVVIVTRFEYPSPKIVRLVQTIVRRSDGVVAGVVTSVTGLLDLASRRLVDDAAGCWASFLRDPAVVGLSTPSTPKA